MRAVDIIEKKKQGYSHTKEEIDYFIKGYIEGFIEDYQMSAWLMAVCFSSFNFYYTPHFTQNFLNLLVKLAFFSFIVFLATIHSTSRLVLQFILLFILPLSFLCLAFSSCFKV